MCFWGVAMALGPDINTPADPDRTLDAFRALEQARALVRHAPPVEQAYVAALTERYRPDPTSARAPLDRAYSDAMRRLTRAYPDDLDAATFFAESLMDLHPWDLWLDDGSPRPETTEIVSTLERVLAADPYHPGANHYYVHAVEASPHPERAIQAADRLARLMPGAGHIVHMPSHIYMRVGRYADASDANARAIEVDRDYTARNHPGGMYWMYAAHNLAFLSHAAAMEGRFSTALNAARAMASVAPAEHLAHMPPALVALPLPVMTLLRFDRWNDVLAEPLPAEVLRYPLAMTHFARGVAFARLGRIDEARAEATTLDAMRVHTATDEIAGNNRVVDLLEIATHVLAAEIDRADSRSDEAIASLVDAVQREDRLHYDEPADWYPSVRLRLGEAHLVAHQFAEAERTYREDLRRNPENGWALRGLVTALRGEGNEAEAARVEQRFRTAWRRADAP
jgi:tetratricopeptide (TPR) repeat protein